VGLRRLSIAAVVVLGALVFATGTQACSCTRVPRDEAIRQADAAIAGELVKVVPQNRQRAAFRYRVQRVYKGGHGIRVGDVVSVRSARDSAACGLPTRTGRRYGLALSWSDGGWTSGACALLRGCAS
jgi:hypothetical protein